MLFPDDDPLPAAPAAKPPRPKRERLFLIDGTAMAFRSHYAMFRTQLTAPDGTPTGATYGFANSLRRILEDERPERLAVAFDHRSPTFRHERYAEYKATRQRAPEELIAQMDWIKEVVRAQGLPIFEIPGYEADDVIGTLALQGAARGWDVLMVTGDKDFMQLVSDDIRLYNIFKRDEADPVIEGVEAVRAKFGTGPEGVVDVLAVMGDASDNVPGVKGIGEKGAIKLIEQHGSVQGILDHLADLPAKTREKIEASRENLLLSRELVTIDTAVPLDPGLESIGPPAPDLGALRELYAKLDFRSLANALTAPAAPKGAARFTLVESPEQLAQLLESVRAVGGYAVDTETTSLFPLEAELVGISMCSRAGEAFYVPFNSDPPLFGGTPAENRAAILEAVRPVLEDKTLLRVGQNHKYDALVLRKHGLDLPPPSFDTMVASFCVAGSGRRHNLDALALHYFNIAKIPTTELIGTGQKQVTMDQVDVAKVAEYACEDAEVTWRLRPELKEELQETGLYELFRELEMPLVPVLTAMEWRGIRLDTDLLARIGTELEADMIAAADDVQRLAGREFNVNSTKVLGQILFEELRIQDQAGVKKPKQTKTGWATDAETLSSKYPDVEIVARLLEYREIAKLKGTYVDALPRYVNPDTGRVHCSFSQVSAATGRLASSDPNLQNIPVRTERGRQLRQAFVPREPDEPQGSGKWVLLAADYSQIELRVMAHLSGDDGLRTAFEQGQDIHAATASRIFEVAPDQVDRAMRSQAKVINFGLLYGMGPQRVARETNMSVAEAKEFIDRYFGAFPKVRVWIDALLESARELGYVETLLGRRRQVPDIQSNNPRVASMAENAAVNTPVQGSAADIIKRAMIDLEAALSRSPLQALMLLQVHDELVLEVPERELDETIELVRQCMEHAVELSVPIKVDFGHGANWLEAH